MSHVHYQTSESHLSVSSLCLAVQAALIAGSNTDTPAAPRENTPRGPQPPGSEKAKRRLPRTRMPSSDSSTTKRQRKLPRHPRSPKTTPTLKSHPHPSSTPPTKPTPGPPGTQGATRRKPRNSPTPATNTSKSGIVVHGVALRKNLGNVQKWLESANKGLGKITGIRWLRKNETLVEEGKLASSVVVYLEECVEPTLSRKQSQATQETDFIFSSWLRGLLGTEGKLRCKERKEKDEEEEEGETEERKAEAE
ncbi:hypothetical protein BDZ91DRAFT_793128 [Kalaharituber pfeilii]|nr:hypothetical protein BDZ91DRAFT_793128 [Kalaharituber pfeilii]